MTICIKVSPTVQFTVKGSINDERGQAQPFQFRLTCKRLDTEQFREATRDIEGRPLVDFMVPLVEGWSGVKDPKGDDVPYTPEALRELCRIPGVAQLVLNTYAIEAGARAKN